LFKEFNPAGAANRRTSAYDGRNAVTTVNR
jgi:hypothetical protein